MTAGASVEVVRDEASGLWAVIAVDRRVDGVSAGGIRVKPYPSDGAAVADAVALARAMSVKAALSNVRCGGAKVVVRADLLRDRRRALERLGERVEARGGALYVGPDFGFTDGDRDAVARATRYVDPAEIAGQMAAATAAGVRECLAAALGVDRLDGRRIALQGLGAVGGALAALLAAEGASLVGYDVDPGRLRAAPVEPARDEAALFATPCDAVVPCALGGAVDVARVAALACRALVGAANHLLAEPAPAVAEALAARGIVHVPDVVANAGALVYWARSVLARDAAGAHAAVRRIGDTARLVLARARERGATPLAVAHALADERLARADA